MIIISIGTKKNTSTTEVLDASIIGIPKIIETLESPDLFGETKHYKIIRADDSPELKDELIELLAVDHAYVHSAEIVLEKLLAGEKKKIESRVTISETKSTKESKSAGVNPFALGEAIASGDKKKAWTLFHEITHYDDEIEKTHGLVWWKIKDMLTKRSVYSKEVVIDIARLLVGVYHESRLGGVGMKERLEQCILTLPPVAKK